MKSKKLIILGLVFDRLDRFNTYCGDNTLSSNDLGNLQEFWEVTITRKNGKVSSFNRHVAERILDILIESTFETPCSATVEELKAEIQDLLQRAKATRK